MAAAYRPRLLLIIVCALIVAQIFVVTSLKQDFERQLAAARETITTQTLLQGALVNLLVEKNIITRDDILKETRAAISKHFMDQGRPADPPFDTTGFAGPDTAPANR